MLTIEQFCGAVAIAECGEGGFDVVGKEIRWGYCSDNYPQPICDFLKGSGIRIPKYIRDACEGKNLKDAKTAKARKVLERVFVFGEGEDGEFTDEQTDLCDRCCKAAEKAGLDEKLPALQDA